MKLTVPHPASVLLVAEPLVPGASAIYAQYLMSGLTHARIHHPMLTPSAPGLGLLSKEEARYVQTAEGLDWLSWRPFVFRNILAWARREEPELLHGISEQTAAICAALSEELELPYLLSIHHFSERRSLHLNQYCQAVIADSVALRKHLIEVVKLPAERVLLVPPGVSDTTGIFGAATVAADEPHASMDTGIEIADTPPDAHLVVSIGDLNRTSDYATFMEAVPRIVNKDRDACSIVICGEGPQEASLRQFCRELALDRRVTFCHGHTEIERLLSDADVFVQTTRREGFAIRVLQAMMLGVPVVAASNNAVLELIKDGETGFIVPPANHAMLAERIQQLLADRALREKIGTAAREWAHANYSAEKMMDATLKVYREAVS